MSAIALPQVQIPAGALQLAIPDWAGPIFERGRWRIKALHGGRGGAKTRTFARAAIFLGGQEEMRFACVREHQKSIRESARQTLVDEIARMHQRPLWHVTRDNIDHRQNGTHFFFSGLSTVSEEDIHGWENVDVCWVEQAERMSARSWEILEPTIRKAGSEIWFSLNPRKRHDPAYLVILQNRPDTWSLKVNYTDNPFFHNDTALEKIRQNHERYQPDRYAHIWLGEPDDEGAEKVVIPYALAKACVDAWPRWLEHLKEHPEDAGLVAGGLDVADTGAARNALGIRKGPALTSLERFSEETLGKTTRRAHRRLVEAGALSLYFDAGGVGAGVKSHLADLEAEHDERVREAAEEALEPPEDEDDEPPEVDEDALPAFPYAHNPEFFGGKVAAPDGSFVEGHTNAEFFADRAAQMGWNLRIRATNTQLWLDGEPGVEATDCLFINPAIPEQEVMLAQLNQPVWREGQGGKLKIEKAPDGAASPDAYDGTILTFAGDTAGLGTEMLDAALARRLARMGGG